MGHPIECRRRSTVVDKNKLAGGNPQAAGDPAAPPVAVASSLGSRFLV